MSRYILDTDHVSLFQRNHPQIVQKVREIDTSNLFVTIVTLEEQLRGRLAVISKANQKSERLAIAYQNLRSTLVYFCNVQLLDFDEAAYNCYQDLRQNLRQQKLSVGTQDLKIAAIALRHQAIVVTRNHKDFGKVSNLLLEDWTLEHSS